MLAACVVAGCDDSSPTAPSAMPLVFTAQLSPANEVPAIANAEATGQGAAQITFDVTRDSSGTITGGTATFYFQLSGFQAGTEAVAAHIHSAVAGVNGPMVDSGVVPSAAVAIIDGTASYERGGIPVSAALISAMPPTRERSTSTCTLA